MSRVRTRGAVRTTVWSEALTLAPILLVALAGAEYAARSQAGHLPLLRAGAAVLLTQVLPGFVLWRVLRPRRGWLVEDLALGAACGAALAVPAQVVSLVTGFGPLRWVLPLAVAAVLVAVPGSRRRVVRAQWLALPWWWGPAVGLVGVKAVSVGVSIFAQPMAPVHGWMRQYIDLPYHLALAGELAHHFPPHQPQVAAEPLHYHWFSYAWMAQVGGTSGSGLDVVLLRFMPVYVAILLTLAIAAAALRLSRLPAAGPVAAGTAMALAALPLWGPAETSFLPMTPLSPTLGFGAVVACPAIALLALRWRAEAPPGSVWALALLVTVAGGAKGSFGPVLLAGCATALAVALLLRSGNRRVVALDTAVVGFVLVLLLSLVFHGNEGGMTLTHFTALATSRGSQIIGTAVVSRTVLLELEVLLAVALVLPGLAAVVGLLRERTTARDPMSWFLLGASAAGFGAVLLLLHPSESEFYFTKSAGVMLALAVGCGLSQLVADIRARWWLPVVAGALGGWWLVGVAGRLGVRAPSSPHPVERALLAIVLLVGGLALLALAVAVANRLLGRHSDAAPVIPGRRGFGFAVCLLVGLLVAGGAAAVAHLRFTGTTFLGGPSNPDSVSAGQLAAARYLNDRAGPDDVVMTNRHCRVPRGRICDHRHFWIAAYAERRVLVEGWAYTAKANAAGNGAPFKGTFWDPALLRLNDGFFTHPSQAAARQLWALGVRWAFVDRTVPGAGHTSLAPYARLRLENGTAQVWRLVAPPGAAPAGRG
ncbi:MAG: hypothetical protein M3130_10255 [Actinomycetota bacterium]|nr:hypothetical protein [Actinomycetota bacterium]